MTTTRSTTLLDPGPCAFDWCINDHTESTAMHYAADTLVADQFSNHVGVSLFHDATAQSTGIYLGSRQFHLCGGLEIAHSIQQAVTIGIDLPGALRMEEWQHN
jgi:hypothetical protein